MILFVEYNSFYLFVIVFVFFIGVLEMILLIFGYFFLGVFDVYFDYYDVLLFGFVGQVFYYLNIGCVFVLVVFCLLVGYFGFFGIFI